MKTNTLLKITSLVLIFLICTNNSFGQLIDDFSDSDFSSNPSWIGTSNNFIVNSSQQLQLNASIAGTSYLTTPHQLSNFDNKEWRVWIKQNFSGSSSNFGRYYLIAENSNLSTSPDGTYLQLGEANSTDAVRLVQQVGGLTITLFSSANGSIANPFEITVQLKRSNTGLWSLAIDWAGGTDFTPIATGQEAVLPNGNHTGYHCTYTASNGTKFYLDNVYVGEEIIDNEAPTMDSVIVVNNQQLKVLFNEKIEQQNAENNLNYQLSPTIGIDSIRLDATTKKFVSMYFSAPFINGQTYTLSSENIEDLAGNSSSQQSKNFTYLVSDTALVGDIIINEFFADPDPQIGLPEVEYVELFNKSTKIFNLGGWKLGDNASFGTLQNKWLYPGEYAVLCPIASVNEFQQATGVTSFPSLNNTSDMIRLKSNLGTLIDSIAYDQSWYHDESKKNGGWSIELINPYAPCNNKNNWRASISTQGGTPGTINSVFSTETDTIAPKLLTIEYVNKKTIRIILTEEVDSIEILQANIQLQPTISIASREVITGLTSVFILHLNDTLVENSTYTLQLENISDCWGNSQISTQSFFVPLTPKKGDLIINEILFNPLTGGSDWIELYNHSSGVIDLKNCKISRTLNGVETDIKTITQSYYLQPQDFVVIGADSQFVKVNYPSASFGNYIQMSLPTMSNGSGSISVSHAEQVTTESMSIHLLDQLNYNANWHFKLIEDVKGKSLERISYSALTQDQNNWHTASESEGFATPGRVNSQTYSTSNEGELSLSSETISPDNDGFEDFLKIEYEMNESGMVATLSIFDDRGILIRQLVKNELLGMNGTFTWDGLNDTNLKARIGPHILLFESYHPTSGNKIHIKKVVTVVGKMNY